MEKDSPADSSPSSLFKRFLQIFKFFKAPDTAEDLEQEIHEILEEGEEQGLISRQEGEMISSIFEFRDTIAREIMTPLNDMVCAPADATIADLVGLITERGFSRIPVYSDNRDHIIGILHAKDLLHYCARSDTSPQAREITKPAYFIPENEKIVDLLRRFQSQNIHMAVVTDEFGGVRGLITLEDIIEEIVGEITDEYDKEEHRFKVVDEQTVLCDARINVEIIEKHFGIDLPEGDYESVGGLIILNLGRVPEPGVSIEVNNLEFHVLSSTKRRINKVKIIKKTL